MGEDLLPTRMSLPEVMGDPCASELRPHALALLRAAESSERLLRSHPSIAPHLQGLRESVERFASAVLQTLCAEAGLPAEGESVSPVRAPMGDYRIDRSSNCWIWMRSVNASGYPIIGRKANGRENVPGKIYWMLTAHSATTRWWCGPVGRACASTRNTPASQIVASTVRTGCERAVNSTGKPFTRSGRRCAPPARDCANGPVTWQRALASASTASWRCFETRSGSTRDISRASRSPAPLRTAPSSFAQLTARANITPRSATQQPSWPDLEGLGHSGSATQSRRGRRRAASVRRRPSEPKLLPLQRSGQTYWQTSPA